MYTFSDLIVVLRVAHQVLRCVRKHFDAGHSVA